MRYLLRPSCVVGAPAVVGSLKIVYIIFDASIPAVAKVSVLAADPAVAVAPAIAVV